HFVQRALLAAVAAVDRNAAADVRGVAVQFGAGVDQQQVAGVQPSAVVLVVHRAGVAAGGDDGSERGYRATTAQRVQQLGFHLIFVPARQRAAPRGEMRLGGDAGGGAHQLQLGTRLVQAQVVQQVPQR